jgi:hypothetical protein
MTSSASLSGPQGAQFTSVWRVELAKPAEQAPSPVQAAAEAIVAERKAQTINQLLPGQLMIEVDHASGRFVQTMKDASEEVLWRFPNETQLAFSRAVVAYVRASDVANALQK